MPVYILKVSFDNNQNEGGRQTEYFEIESEAPKLAEIEATAQISSLLNLQQSPLSRVSNLATEIIPPDQAEELVIKSRPKPDGGYLTVAEAARETTLSIRSKRLL